jgi:hypothetical protein
MFGVHTKGCLDPQAQYKSVLQDKTVMATGEACHEYCNSHVGLTILWQVEVVTLFCFNLTAVPHVFLRISVLEKA